ncbi:hypothetical protein NFI96_034097 [Prochilodus magdalenae]|nr:hypothetical protein NFI96_034097 [Prochilodus magdalenae]
MGPFRYWLKIMMMTRISDETKLDLSRLTDEEARHIWQVIQRDFSLRKKEEDRLGDLKSKIVEEDTKRELLGYQYKLSDSLCIRCLQPFKFLLNTKRQCLDCKLFVCKACSHFNKKDHGWVCDPCKMTRVLKIGTLEWFHENVRTRFKRFGSANVMKSLYKRQNREQTFSQTGVRELPEADTHSMADVYTFLTLTFFLRFCTAHTSQQGPAAPASGRRRSGRTEHPRWKRDKRGGPHARLKARATRPPLPSLLILTETWLSDSTPDSAIQLQTHSVHRGDCTAASGNNKGGGVCVFVNNRWCSDIKTVEKHCSTDIELLMVKCRPFYLPREFSAVFILVVYIPPRANSATALGLLHDAISKQETAHPDAVFIVCGDFNNCNLGTVLPKYHQHVSFLTRENNILDQVYSNVRGGYKAAARPHFGRSDHISVFLYPAYRQLLKQAPPVNKTIKVWTEETDLVLQDCFDTTDWEVFRTAAVREDCNTKGYKRARYDLHRSIRQAKRQYRVKLEGCYTSADSRRMWQGLRHITDYQQRSREVTTSHTTLPDELNEFYARFEALNYGQGDHAELIACCDIAGGVQGSEENNPTEGRWPRQHPRVCTQGLLFRAGWHVCGHIQPMGKDTCVRMLFIDYRSAFNTAIPTKLPGKLLTLGLTPRLCNWVLNFLMDRPQSVRIGSRTSSTRTVSTGTPQGCVLSPLLYTLFMYDCVASQSNTSIIKFADDTTIIGLITGGDETAYRREVAELVDWCDYNHLSLNTDKTKKINVDRRRRRQELHTPLFMGETEVERVKTFKFLGVHINENLTWSHNTHYIVHKSQQRLYFLRRLRKFGMSAQILSNFYRSTIESVLTSSITVWTSTGLGSSGGPSASSGTIQNLNTAS